MSLNRLNMIIVGWRWHLINIKFNDHWSVHGHWNVQWIYVDFGSNQNNYVIKNAGKKSELYNSFCIKKNNSGDSSVGRASDWRSEGHVFDPRSPHFYFFNNTTSSYFFIKSSVLCVARMFYIFGMIFFVFFIFLL